MAQASIFKATEHVSWKKEIAEDGHHVGGNGLECVLYVAILNQVP